MHATQKKKTTTTTTRTKINSIKSAKLNIDFKNNNFELYINSA
jgi:hypothetical protein